MMRAVRRLYSVTHNLVSLFFSAYLPLALKIFLLALILLFTAGERATAAHTFSAAIKERTSRFVYTNKNKVRRFFSRGRGSSTPAQQPRPPPECAICLEDFVEGEAGTELERCGHKFHASCVGRWLLRCGNWRVSCPLCRVPVVCENVAAVMEERHRLEKREGPGCRRRVVSTAMEGELCLLLLPGLNFQSFHYIVGQINNSSIL
ncbi:hypothetical protein DM860_017050 [Cuscuta australis]|uniref:RING-type domain-containing protein n=1 Tax=Cuscuta australis TaxID=267555 RepID=A0A328DRN0_9ASTE|nr:hypothetical protein DM860_017050 [Cuscuta australis]